METDRIEEILSSYKGIKKRIEILEDDLDSIEANGVSALSFPQINGGKTNSVARPTEEQAVNMAEKKKEIEKEIEILKKQISILDKALEGLSNLEREVVWHKVVKNEPYFRICGNVQISESHAKRVKKNGIQHIKEILDPKNIKGE